MGFFREILQRTRVGRGDQSRVSEDLEIHSPNKFRFGTIEISKSTLWKLTFMLLGDQTVKLGNINPSFD